MRYVLTQTGGKTQSKDDERTIMKILRKEGGKGDSELYIQVVMIDSCKDYSLNRQRQRLIINICIVLGLNVLRHEKYAIKW